MADLIPTPDQQPTERAVWSAANTNDLPDSAFAYIEPGGKKDEEGKTTPRSLRHLPYKNADGKVDPAHVRNALARLSQTQIPESAKASARRKLVAAANSVGIEVSDDDDSKERTMPSDDTLTLTITRASADHEPFTGTHSHAHPAFGSQGDDAGHEHEHSHDGDNNHDHGHAERSADGAIQASDRPTMYAPFLRIDAAKREVIGQATAEVPDSYKTIFGYYPKAFELWRGNIREQHDPKKAVGRRVDFFPHDDTRSVDLLSRVSRGAPDTWAKVEDNVLTGYSLSVIPDPEFGPDPSRWPKKEHEGKLYPYLPRYSIAEVSLVDNPACPGCNIQIVRADGFATDVLDLAEEETTPAVVESPVSSLDRAGARVSSETRGAMHEGIGHTLKAAVSQMKNCNCDDCQAAMKLIDPDGDNDIDLGGYSDPDQDWQSLYGGSNQDTERMLSGLIERVLDAKLYAVYARLQGIAGTIARSYAAPTEASLNTLITGAIERAVQSAKEANDSSLSEVRASLETVKATVERIDNTPMPGAPIMNAGALPPRPVDKRLATDPYQAPQRSGSSVYDAIAQLSAQGQLDTIDKQVDALHAGLVAQRRG